MQVWLYRNSVGVNYAVGSTGRSSFHRIQPDANEYMMADLKRIHDAYKGDVEFRNEVPRFAKDAEMRPKPLDEAKFKEILAALNGK